MRIVYLFTLLFLLNGCTKDDTNLIVNEELLVKHQECMSILTDLPLGTPRSENKIIGELINPFVINNEENHYEFKVLYGTRFSTTNSNTSGEVQILSNSVLLLFENKEIDKGIGLDIDVTKKEVNDRIQELLGSDKKVPLSTNLIDKGIHFFIDQGCRNSNYMISSQYSSKESQNLIVDEFKFSSRNDSIYYELKFHLDDIELASRQFNDFDHPKTKEWRQEYNPVYDVNISAYQASFSIPL